MRTPVLVLALAGAGCGGGAPSCEVATSGLDAQYVVGQLMVPHYKSEHAYDLNGDDKLDNQMGNLSGSLQSVGIDMPLGADLAVAAGSVLLLLDESAADLRRASCARVAVSLGEMPLAAPRFDGQDAFLVDGHAGSGHVIGPIVERQTPARASTCGRVLRLATEGDTPFPELCRFPAPQKGCFVMQFTGCPT